MEKVRPLNGYVALIDVLGFRELVGRDNELSEVQKYIDTVVSLLEEKEHVESLQFVLFSDNLVINTEDDSENNFRRLVVACSRISLALMDRFIAVRGAIARGRFIRSPTTAQGVILAGRPIVDANDYQHRQNWVGIILAPSAVRGREEKLEQACTTYAPNPGEQRDDWIHRNFMAMHLQRYQRIPFHPDSAAYDGYAIVPIERESLSSSQRIRARLGAAAGQLEKMKSTAPDPGSQEKFTAARDFLNTTANRWSFNVPWES